MAAIFQMTFWNKFSCMKIVAFQLTFTEIDSQAANQQQTSIRSNNGLALNGAKPSSEPKVI